MAVRTLDPKLALKLMKRRSISNYRPRQITELEEQIAAEIRAMELRGRAPTEEEVQKVAMMMHKKDNLYIDWAEGKIE